jgi:glycosyltransferase involved in cell wall biosynthesis
VRIFIDCSYVDFSRQPTGIPRVVLKYIESGYTWSKIHGVDVVPVVTTKDGLVPVRPIPGSKPPPTTIKYVKRAPEDQIEVMAATTFLRDAASALHIALLKAGASSPKRTIEAEVLALFAKILTSESLVIDLRPGDIVFFPAYWHDLETELLTDLKISGAKIFILVHDILPVKFKRFYQTPWREQFADNLLAACTIADGVLAVSHYTATDVLKFAGENGLRLKHVEVFHNAFDSLIDDQATMRAISDGSYSSPFVSKNKHEFLRVEQPYLMVGTIEPKKGHIPVIQSFERLWCDGFGRKLVLVGRRGWMEEDVVLAIKSSPFFEEKLFWFDDFSDVDLYFAYIYSRALIFASYAEGFGIPLIEAAKSGVPMVCHDTEIAREVAGDYALYYSTFDEFKAHIAAIEDDNTYCVLKQALTAFSWPSWQETGTKLFDYLASSASSSTT